MARGIQSPVSRNQTLDVPGQLHLFPSLTGASFDLQMQVDYSPSADPKIVQRLHRVKGRLSRGALASEWKLRKLATQLESIAGLFDGAA